MYDFQPVAVSELGAIPLLARHDLAIEFDSHTICLHAERLNEPRQSKGCFEIAVLSVDDYLHLLIFASGFGFVQGHLPTDETFLALCGKIDWRNQDFNYSSLRRRNLRVAVRPEKFA